VAVGSIIAFLPKLLGFLVILLIGWWIAGLLANLVAALMRSVRFNELSDRAGITGFIHNAGLRMDGSKALAEVVKWAIRLLMLVVAFDALGLPAVSQVLQQFLTWLPNLVVALIMLVVAGLAANALAGIVRGATASARLSNPDLIASIARVAVWAFGIIVAINQLGIASTLINTLFTAVVGALALAPGLAFGLGGRETAAQAIQNWYQKTRENAPRLADAAQAAGEQARSQAQNLRDSNRR
jgi:hypothetical protein